jgi:hypothetical protein
LPKAETPEQRSGVSAFGAWRWRWTAAHRKRPLRKPFPAPCSADGQPFGEGNFPNLRDTPLNGTAPLAPTIRRPDFLLATIITRAFFVFHGHLLFPTPAFACHTVSVATPGRLCSEETHAWKQQAP